MGKFDIAGIAEGAAGGIIGTGMGLLLEGHNDRRQLAQEAKLQAQQMAGQKEMAEFNRIQQMKMWEDTNYGAQIKQLKKAGLNPGLIYGMSGGGGATTQAAQAAGPTTGSAPRGGGEAMGLMQSTMSTAAQTALIQAQKDLIEAQTKTEGQKPANIAASTENTILDSIIKEYTGKEAKDTYEQVTSPNRGIQAKTYQDELEARQGIAGTIYEMWVDGKLKEKSLAEVEQLLLGNEKLKGETRNIIKTFDILEENLKGAKLDNIIRDLETRLQMKTGIDKASPAWMKVLGRLFVNIMEK